MKKYYAIKWGGQTRISKKSGGIREACMYCYGICAGNMLFKDLGTTKGGVRKRLSKLDTPEDGEWKPIPDSELDRLELMYRNSGGKD